MKNLIFLLLWLPVMASAQQFVPTTPALKNVVLEEFSGIRCGICPQSHQIVADILLDHPGRVFPMNLHPTGDAHTEPLNATDPDLRNSYANNFWYSGFFGGNLYMPSAMVNRRIWATDGRGIGRQKWALRTAEILTEPAPLNIDLQADYDAGSQELTVKVEVFYTDSVPNIQKLCVVLTEDSIRTRQSGFGDNYPQPHVFRASLTGSAWGQVIIQRADSGRLVQKTYTYDNSDGLIDMSHCQAIAYVRDHVNDEIVNGMGRHVTVNGNTGLPPVTLDHPLKVLPNPVQHQAFISFTLNQQSSASFTFYDLQGKIVDHAALGQLAKGNHEVVWENKGLSAGIYFLELTTGEGVGRKKIMLNN